MKDTAETYAADCVAMAQKGWINGTETIEGKTVGIKAHGKWIQRIEVNGMRDSGEFGTQRDMREFIITAIRRAP